MKNTGCYLTLIACLFFAGCTELKTQPAATNSDTAPAEEQAFNWEVEKFADVGMLRYRVPGWQQLSLAQKQFAYYLVQAGLAGRDMMWDQNYRHNLAIRQVLENIYTTYDGDKTAPPWHQFVDYLKRVWFSNGIHHHYAMTKHVPEFSRDYFVQLAKATDTTVSDQLLVVIFDPAVDAKKVALDAEAGLLEKSAVNFYAPSLTTTEVINYYAKKMDKTDAKPISYGLNSRLVKNAQGEIEEHTWKVDGLYGAAIQRVVDWLEKASGVAENPAQAEALQTLIAYYRSGDLKLWDKYNIQWTEATDGDIDYINGFVEVYNDPLGYRGSYENIVQIKDFEASRRMQTLMQNAQWFEDNAPLMDAHKRQAVVGISYNVVSVVGAAGDSSPSSPTGVNLPNANWIRASVGSKSVSLGNVQEAYEESSGGDLLREFAHDEDEVKRGEQYGALATKLSTALHEVIGHASGQLETGVGTPKETLQNYSSTIEEGRADLTALYYSLDPKMVELGVIPSLGVGKARYDGYIRVGLLSQLRRIQRGEVIEEAHMRNRAWISRWVLEQGAADQIIVAAQRDGKTYYDIRDYNKLRDLFGQLWREVQRIKSQGDYAAAKALVEGYGVKVNPKVHKQVLARAEALNIPPYQGFVNPILIPVVDSAGHISDITLEYAGDFAEQMLYYSKNYSFLPLVN